MSDFALQVRNLSKRYRLGERAQVQDTLVGLSLDWLKSPRRNLKRIRDMTRFTDEDTNVIWALDDVSFSVKKGEVVGIIGANGSGKSTLLKLLSRITEPTSGEADIRGRLAALVEVGTGFHPELTGRENVYMNGTVLGLKRKEIDLRFDQIVEFAGVERFIDTQVKFYSSGMKVRLGFSVAAHLDPDIFLIDEVLSVGDAEFQKRCLGRLESVAESGRTVLFVSHDMGAIHHLCPRVIVLKNGQIIFDGDKNNAIERYLNQAKQSEISRPQPTSEFFLKSLFVDDGHGIPALDVPHDREITVRVEIAGPIRGSRPILALVLLNRYKTPVFTRHVQLGDYPNEKSIRLAVTFDGGVITPGPYSWRTRIHDAFESFDYLEETTPFRIFDAGSPMAQYENKTFYGSIFMDARVKKLD